MYVDGKQLLFRQLIALLVALICNYIKLTIFSLFFLIFHFLVNWCVIFISNWWWWWLWNHIKIIAMVEWKFLIFILYFFQLLFAYFRRPPHSILANISRKYIKKWTKWKNIKNCIKFSSKVAGNGMTIWKLFAHKLENYSNLKMHILPRTLSSSISLDGDLMFTNTWREMKI